jgi:hypothetical protein
MVFLEQGLFEEADRCFTGHVARLPNTGDEGYSYQYEPSGSMGSNVDYFALAAAARAGLLRRHRPEPLRRARVQGWTFSEYVHAWQPCQAHSTDDHRESYRGEYDVAVHQRHLFLAPPWTPSRKEEPGFFRDVPDKATIVEKNFEGGACFVAGPGDRLWLLSGGGHSDLTVGTVNGRGQYRCLSPPAPAPGYGYFGGTQSALWSQGALWIATDAGVVRLRGQQWTFYQTTNGPVWTITGLRTDPYSYSYHARGQRRQWVRVARFSGLFKGGWRSPRGEAPELAVDSGGRIWCGDHYLDGTKWRPATGQLAHERQHSIVLHDGRLWQVPDPWWAATGSQDTFAWSCWCDNVLAHRRAISALDPDGRLWVGSDGGGLAIFDGYHWAALNAEDGLPGNSVAGVAFSGRTAWVTTGLGVGRVDF